MDISYYSIGDVLNVAEFRRGRRRGSRDKKPRRRRTGLMVGGGLAAAGTVGYGGRLGMAGYRGVQANRGMYRSYQTGTQSALRGMQAAVVSDAGAISRNAASMGRGINARTRKAVGTVSNSVKGMAATPRGRAGLALAGAAAIGAGGAGIYGMARRRRR